MPLAENKVPFQIRGLETKLDPRAAVIGDAVELENVRFDNPPSIHKRYGSEVLATLPVPGGGTTSPTGKLICAFEDELLLGTGTELYGYNPAAGITYKGPLEALRIGSTEVQSGDGVISAYDCVVHPNGITVTVWETYTEQAIYSSIRRYHEVWYSVGDTVTGQPIQRPVRIVKQLSVGATKYVALIRAVALGSYVSILYRDLAGDSGVSGTICAHTFSTTAFSTDFMYPPQIDQLRYNGTNATLVGGSRVSEDPSPADAVVINDELVLAYAGGPTTATVQPFIRKATYNGTWTVGTEVAYGASGAQTIQALAVFAAQTGYCWLVIAGAPRGTSLVPPTVTTFAAGLLYAIGGTPSLSTALNVGAPYFSTTRRIRKIAGVSFIGSGTWSSYNGTATVVADEYSADGSVGNNFISTFSLTPGGQVLSLTLAEAGVAPVNTFILARSVSLASKPFFRGSRAYVLVQHESKLQNTYFVVAYDPHIIPGSYHSYWPTVVGRGQAGLAGPTLTNYMAVPACAQPATDHVLIAASSIVRSSSVGGKPVSRNWVKLISLTFNASQFSLEMADGLFITGGQLNHYDSSRVAEHGFHLYPEGVSVSVVQDDPATRPALTVIPIFTNQAPVAGTTPFPGTQTVYFRVASLRGPTAPYMPYGSVEGWASDEWYDDTTLYGGPCSILLQWAAGTVPGLTGHRVYFGYAPDTYVRYVDVPAGTNNIVLQGPEFGFAKDAANGYPLIVPGSGATDTYQFQVCAVYEWLDAEGILYRSAPSEPVQVSGMLHNFFTYTVPTLRLTAKRTPISVVVYRTLANQSVMFRTTSISSPTRNDASVDSVTVQEGSSEEFMAGNEQLTFNPLNSAAEVAPLAAPACSYITRYRNRAILIPSELHGVWLFSKTAVPGVPVEFNDQQFFQPIHGGVHSRVTGAKEMDDKLILCTTDGLYWTVGDGPAPNGTGNDYGNAWKVPTEVGCNEPRSLLVTSLGMFFQAIRGIHLLGRDLSVSYVGAPVEAYNGIAVTSANSSQNSQRLIFTLADGRALVYDTLVKLWCLWTSYAAVDAVVKDGLVHRLTSAGVILRETFGAYLEAGQTILMKLKSSWLSFAGLAGYQRLWRLILRGDYKTPHRLAYTLDFDGENGTPAATQSGTLIIEAAPLAYEHQIRPSVQKCSTVRLTITESQPNPATTREGFSLTGIAFLVGQEPGLHKIARNST